MSALQILPHPQAHAVRERGGQVAHDRFRLVFTGGVGDSERASARHWLAWAGHPAFDVEVDGQIVEGVL
jgi:hypothetical protein